MAFINTQTAPRTGFLEAFWNALMAVAEHNPKMKQIEALQALSDEELQARGLRREDIARHVFGDCHWV